MLIIANIILRAFGTGVLFPLLFVSNTQACVALHNPKKKQPHYLFIYKSHFFISVTLG